MTADCALTVLHSINKKHAAKRFSINRKTGQIKNRSYDNEKYFRVEEIKLAGFEALAATLTRLTKEPHAFVVRGEALPGINRKYARRLLHRDPRTREEPAFKAVPRHWFALDMDHIDCPAAIDPRNDPDAAIEYLIGLLPPELVDAECWWQFTSSQSLPGQEDMLSARLWYWSEETLDDAALKRWTAAVNRAGVKLVDPVLYSAVQAHYTAAPLFDGLNDPLRTRSGIRRGFEESVSLVIPPADTKNCEIPGAQGYESGAGVEAYLAKIGGPEGFRGPIKSAIASYVAHYGSKADPEPLKTAIRTAIAHADPGGRSADQLARYTSDEHLDGLIRWTHEHHGDQPPKGLVGEPSEWLDQPPPLDPDQELLPDPVPTTYAELIDTFNRRYAVANEAGKAMIFEPIMDPVRRRQVLTRIRFEDLRKFYMNRTLTRILINPKTQEPKEVTKTHAEWWLSCPLRRQYIGGVIFDPTGKSTPEFWNLWTGFTVTPAPGDWSLMQDHIRHVICAGIETLAEYVFNYIARMFQHPDKPGEVAIVLRGGRGVGKGILLNWLLRAWGQHGVHISNAKHLVGNFNAHLRDCVMLFADEAFFAGDRSHEGVLKALITEPTLPIEGKYQNLVEVINMLHVFMSSNSDWVVPAAIDERRFCVSDVTDNRVGDRAYFAAITAQMQYGGLAALIHDMLHRDISGFEVRDAPQTAALKTQKTLSLGSIERWWLAVLSRGFLWKSRHGAPWFREWHEFYTTELLWRSYLQWCDEARPYDRKSREQLGAFLTQTYVAARPWGEHPVYEIDVVDRSKVEGAPLPNGGVELVSPPLDEIAIVSLPHRPGYRVSELDEARARFLDMCEVEVDWGLDTDE